MTEIKLIDIDKYYGKNHVLKSLNMKIEKGEFMTLLGPSGCGKTTTLRIIAGLEKPQNGVITMNGKEVVNAAECFYETPDKRNLSLVFQSYALWPHMTVFDNVAFSMTIEKKPQKEIREKVNNALERMQIKEFAKRYPSELSGGQQQRVAIARSIVNSPGLLLLDEPLSNLDAKLRVEMRSVLKRLHQEMGTTIVYVTHDQVEALTMSTRIAVFFEGCLEQVATPMELYQNPCSLKVADFIGNPSINFIDGTACREGDKVCIKSILGDIALSYSSFLDSNPMANEESDVGIGIRPEKVSIHRGQRPGAIPALVYTCQPAGSETIVNLKVKDSFITTKSLGLEYYACDQMVWLEIDFNDMNVFDKESGRLIRKAGSGLTNKDLLRSF